MKELLDEQLAKNKNAKYFVFSDKAGLKVPSWIKNPKAASVRRMVYLDSEVVPEARFYCKAMWFLPGHPANLAKGQNEVEEHVHDYGELIGFFGFNYDNIHDLGAEVEFWIDGVQHLIKETFVAYVPPGVKHCPLNVRNIVRPLMHLTAGPTQMYH
jgi:hypothetical protein